MDMSLTYPETAAELRTIIDTMQDGLFIISDGHLTFANNSFARKLGYSAEETIGLSIGDLVAPEWLDMVSDRYRRRLAGEPVPSQYEFDLLHRNGRDRIMVMMSVDVLRYPDGTVASIGSVKDITQQRQLAHRIEESERELRQILENLPDIFYRTDAEGHIEMISPRVEEYFGYKPYEVLGKKLADYYVDPSERERFLQKLVEANGQPIVYEALMRRKDGGKIWISTRAYLRKNDGGEIIGVEGVAREMTEKWQMEEQLRFMASHDSLTGVFSRGELNNLLDGALSRARRSNASVALAYIDLDGFKVVNDQFGHDEGDKIIAAAAKRITALLRDCDAVVRLGGDEFVVILEGNPQEVDLNIIANKLLTSLRNPFHIGAAEIQLSASIGMSLYPEHGLEQDALLRCADQAMYQAKKLGKDRFGFWSETLNS